MITEYHVQLILGKMDELRKGQLELIDLLKAGQQVQQTTNPLEVHMSEEVKNEAAPSVVIGENGAQRLNNEPVEPTVVETKDIPDVGIDMAAAGTRDKTAVATPKPLSKTQRFKNYRANGGKLSWDKWKEAGQPDND